MGGLGKVMRGRRTAGRSWRRQTNWQPSLARQFAGAYPCTPRPKATACRGGIQKVADPRARRKCRCALRVTGANHSSPWIDPVQCLVRCDDVVEEHHDRDGAIWPVTKPVSEAYAPVFDLLHPPRRALLLFQHGWLSNPFRDRSAEAPLFRRHKRGCGGLGERSETAEPVLNECSVGRLALNSDQVAGSGPKRSFGDGSATREWIENRRTGLHQQSAQPLQ